MRLWNLGAYAFVLLALATPQTLINEPPTSERKSENTIENILIKEPLPYEQEKREKIKPVEAVVDGKKVLLYEFSPREIGLDFIVAEPKKARSFDYFVEKAKEKYGKNLEFVTTANFYDMTSGKLVGRVKTASGDFYDEGVIFKGAGITYSNGEVSITELIPKKEPEKEEEKLGLKFVDKENKNIDLYSMYSNNKKKGKKTELYSKYIELKNKKELRIIDGKAYSYGFHPLIMNGNKAKQIYKRDINPFISRPRSAIGFKKEGNMILVFANSNIPRLQNIMLELNAEDALYPDSGNSRAFYASNKVYKRDNPARRIKAVMIGYSK